MVFIPATESEIEKFEEHFSHFYAIYLCWLENLNIDQLWEPFKIHAIANILPRFNSLCKIK